MSTGLPALVAARWRRLRRPGPDAGFAALELAICATFVVVMLLAVAALGRASRSRQLVDQAAQAAARAGSLTDSPATAKLAGKQAARQTLTGGGLSCQRMRAHLDTKAFYPGGQVVAHVSCVVNLSRFTLAGVPGQVTLHASSTSPLGPHRQVVVPGAGNP